MIAVGALLAAGLGWRYIAPVPAPTVSARFEILPPPGAMWTPSPAASTAQVALSPDGRQLAFVAAQKGVTSQLWIRPLDSIQATPLPGTEGASFPFWSPDGRFLAFFASGKLKKTDTAGGEPQSLTDAVSGRGGSWNPDGVIVFAGSSASGITRIAASGGTVTVVTALDPEQKTFGHSWPQFLPDGRHFLFYQRSSIAEHQGLFVASLDSSTVTSVRPSESMALYASGHLLFVREGILFAQRFDDRAFRTTGEPMRIADHVGYFTGAFGYFAGTASSTGVLVFGPGVALTTQLRWLGRSGYQRERRRLLQRLQLASLIAGPEKRCPVLADTATPERDIWVMNVASGATSRASFDPEVDWFPTWSADGGVMFYGSTRQGVTWIFRKAGAGQDELFYSEMEADRPLAAYPNDTSDDRGSLLYTRLSSRGYDLAYAPPCGRAKAEHLSLHSVQRS